MIPGMPAGMLEGSDEEGSLRMKRMIYMTDSMTAAELDSDGMIFMKLDSEGQPIGLSWRVARVARGSGTSVREVEETLCQYRMMANMAKQAGGKNGWYVILITSTRLMRLVAEGSLASPHRLSAAQKMQQAAGPGLGPGGMPTREQIAAMQVCISLQPHPLPYSLDDHCLISGFFQRAAPPGLLQKMRSAGPMAGMQDMMKAMTGGDMSESDMAEMQSKYFSYLYWPLDGKLSDLPLCIANL